MKKLIKMNHSIFLYSPTELLILNDMSNYSNITQKSKLQLNLANQYLYLSLTVDMKLTYISTV